MVVKRKNSPAGKPRTIDEYLAGVRADQRVALETLRRTIRAAAPKAEEYISYGLAAFRLNGRPLVAFGATANHCAFYPMNSTTVEAFKGQLKGYQTSKGTIRFPADRLLPASLVRKMVKARIAESTGNFRKVSTATKPVKKSAKTPATNDVQSVLGMLRGLSNARVREEMSSRYGIVTGNAFGVRMKDMQQIAKQLGRDHPLAIALWATGNYEARTVAAFVAEPERVTPGLMDRWCRDFDNWAICDTVCFKLFDRTPHAFGKVAQWAASPDEFQKRAAFALLACLALHEKGAGNKAFAQSLPLIEAAAADERNFVKKAVSWALRAIGGRNAELKSAAVALARKLSSAADSASRWVGKDALRSL